MVTLLAWSIASNRESWQEKGLTEWALGTLRHGVDYLAEARISATDIVVQVGDARTDATCDLSVELLDEFRPVLTSSRKYPASDTMGSFVAAIYAAAHAFSVLGDRTEARQCATKGKQSLDSLIRGPKGLTGRNPEYETGQMGSEWFGDCYQDELAWASAWACLGSSGLEICLTKVESLLDEADEKCEQVNFENQWSWNDVRLGTRLLLAQYSTDTKHLNKFVKEMNKITQVGIKQLCQDGFERATALANLFAMTIQLEVCSVLYLVTPTTLSFTTILNLFRTWTMNRATASPNSPQNCWPAHHVTLLAYGPGQQVLKLITKMQTTMELYFGVEPKIQNSWTQSICYSVPWWRTELQSL